MTDATGYPDPYSRAEYRRLIAWGPRIAREGPFLLRVLASAPERSVVDLGCGTGEHAAFFARAPCRAVGLDRSQAMIEAAREHESRGEGRFVLGDVLQASEALAGEPPFGLALCLGNMLPHLVADGELARFLTEVQRLLLPGGKLLFQVLNYERILVQGVRHLPLNFRDGDGGEGEELVFLRIMKPAPHGRILFFPTTLALDPTAEEPLRIESTRRVELRAWTRAELEPALDRAGFASQWRGDMLGGAFEAATSADLVGIATRRA